MTYGSTLKRDVSLCSYPPILTSWLVFTACKIFCISEIVNLKAQKLIISGIKAEKG